MSKAWKDVIKMPVKESTAQPRESGLTMVIDKGIGLNSNT